MLRSRRVPVFKWLKNLISSEPLDWDKLHTTDMMTRNGVIIRLFPVHDGMYFKVMERGEEIWTILTKKDQERLMLALVKSLIKEPTQES
jgi:hypothetical protein